MWTTCTSLEGKHIDAINEMIELTIQGKSFKKDVICGNHKITKDFGTQLKNIGAIKKVSKGEYTWVFNDLKAEPPMLFQNDVRVEKAIEIIKMAFPGYEIVIQKEI